jgi:aminopeptidase S
MLNVRTLKHGNGYPDGGKKGHRSGIATLLIVGIVVAIVVIAGGVTYYLYYLNPSTSHGYGTSSVTLACASGAVKPGSSMSVPYSVALASGGKWGTSVTVTNSSAFQSAGITFSGIGGMSDPPFSGTLSISASSSAKTGTYFVPISATGDDPSSSNAMFLLNVTSAAGSSSCWTSSSSPTTTATTTSTSSGYGYP